MIDCELRGFDCELAGQKLRKARKSAVEARWRSGDVEDCKSTPRPRLADKFARFTLRSTHGIPWVLSAAANSTLRLRIRKGPARTAIRTRPDHPALEVQNG